MPHRGLRIEMLVIGVLCALFLEVDSLKCYQCKVDDNRLCTDELLKDCPKDQAYDRCMTTISQTASEGFYILKKCALAPCELRDPSQKSGLGLEKCDRSKPEYMCVDCCKEDGCNKDAASYLQPSTWIMSLHFFFGVFLCQFCRNKFFL